MKLKYAFTLFFSLFLHNCDNSTEFVEDVATVIPKYDLTIGNSWTYATKVFNADGIVTSHFTTYIKVLRETTLVGEKWLILSEDTINASLRISKLARENANGYYERVKYYNAQLGHTSDTALLIYKYPAPSNTKYLVNPSSQLDGSIYSDTTTIISRSSKVFVPAGTFNCYFYKTIHNVPVRDSLGHNLLYPMYFVNEYLSDSGVVKMEGYSTLPNSPTLLASFELIALKINR